MFERLISSVHARHPDLAAWLVEHGYGRVLSRPGLGERERERVAIAVLAAGGWERQLASHLKGAPRVGASAAQVRVAFEAGRRVTRSRAACRRAWRRAESVPTHRAPRG